MEPHDRKVARVLADLERQGVSRWDAAPPFFRLLWSLGLAVPPPLFLGLRPLALLFGVLFGGVWGVGMWIAQWRFWALPIEASLTFAIIGTVLAGALFGLTMAAYYRWQAGRLHLPSWEGYPDARA
jgi:hypothetical protein